MICGFMERKILYLFQELGNNLPKTEKKHLQQGFVNAITIRYIGPRKLVTFSDIS